MVLMVVGILAMAIVFLLLILAEVIKRHTNFNPEVTRKFVHITVGSFVAFWPLWMSNSIIYLICLAFAVVILITRLSGLFPSIHNIERKTWGDLLFPLGIAATLFLAHEPWIFTAAVLHLSLADGMAALVGVRYGKHNSYKILGYTKTVAGNAAFFVLSLAIVIGLIWVEPGAFSVVAAQALFLVPFFATLVESLAIRGSDNLVVPIVVTLLLNVLQSSAG